MIHFRAPPPPTSKLHRLFFDARQMRIACYGIICAMVNEEMHTISLKVAYNGAPFAGFARQPGLLTVQGELERALEMLLRRPVETTCAGRTDAGVHARGQVVSFDVESGEMGSLWRDSIGFARFQRSMNAITHECIAVKGVDRRAPGFSARFDAKAREYRYYLATGSAKPVFMDAFSWWMPGGLDVAAMQEASRCLIGEQDFKSFCRADSAVGKPTCRNLMEVSFDTAEIYGEDLLEIRVVGSSFLHSMVRTIVGSLCMVGKGQRPVQWMAEALAACDRRAAGETAPAKGLVFWEVTY